MRRIRLPFRGKTTLSGYFYPPVIIAMSVMRIVEVITHQVVDMIAMRYSLVAAAGSMQMSLLMLGAFVPRRAVLWVGNRYAYDVFIDMVVVMIVQVAVVQIIDVIVMHDACMTALRAMRMSMIFVLWQVTIRHRRFLIKK